MTVSSPAITLQVRDLWRAKARLWALRWRSRSLCRSPVFADQAANDLLALDAGGDIGSVAELALRRFQLAWNGP
jgi:hypothetical protein